MKDLARAPIAELDQIGRRGFTYEEALPKLICTTWGLSS
jgi:hypothetical protein